MRGWALGDVPQADAVSLCLLEGLPQAPEDIPMVLGRGEFAGVDSQGVERWSTPSLGFPAGGGVSVRCGGPPICSASTMGSSRAGWVGGGGGVAASFAGRAASRAWPSDIGGGPGRLPGPADRRVSARTVVCAGSGPGSGLGAGRPGDDGSAGRTAGPAGGAWCRWEAGSACAVAGRSPGAAVLGVAGACRFGPSVGLWAWGCTLSEGRVLVVSVGVAARACVGGSSGGVYAGPSAGRSGVPWRGWGSGWACVAAARLAACL